jgi:nucleoside-diphosphate-sugar epimerase
MKKISILGCGWLGFPLAGALLKNGFVVNGSTTSQSKIPVMESLGIRPFIISLNENKITGDIDDFLKNSEILIVAIPPKLRGPEKENFAAKIGQIIPFIEHSGIKKVLFISSTSVYADGNPIPVITETTKAEPDTESGKQLLEAESVFQKSTQFQTTILRFSGLIGEDRHPVHFLAGKENIKNPEGPINLIHRQDCIGIILKIIQKDCWDETFNAAAPFHPDRKKYYSQKAIETGLAVPKFNTGKTIGKIIASDKLIHLLAYDFIWPNGF